MKVNEKKISEISGQLDKLLEKAGQFNRYQFTILILFTFQFILAQFFNTGLFFLSEKPRVIEKANKTNSYIVNQTICKNINNYTLEENDTISRILVEYNIYCDTFKSYLISVCLYAGMLIGSFMSYIFADRIGRKKSLCIIIPIHILSLLTFELTNKEILGKKFKYALYFLYFNIFFKGLSSRIVMILLIIYICDIINQKDIPLFINIILAGTPISEFLSSFTFTFVDINWRHILAFDGFVNIFLFILFLILVIGSPMFCLNNEDYDNFVKTLMKISKFNGRPLNKEDFSFLKPYMSSKQQKAVFVNFEEDMDIGDNKENNLLYDDKYLDKNENINLKNDVVFQSKSELKKDFLIEAKENKNKPYISLFGHLKMKDYSPLDLLKEGQIINFLILSYLWTASTIVRDGFNIYFISIKEFKNDFIYYMIMVFGEFMGFVFIYQTFTRKLTSFHPLLVTLLLSNFLILAIGTSTFKDNKFNWYDFFQLFSIKVFTGSVNLILYIMTLLIYPVIIRTHGLGATLTLASIGDIIALLFDYESNIHDISLYFLVFLFFSLMLSYGLPNQIGTIILAKPKEEEKKPEVPEIDESLDISKKLTNDVILEDDNENDISLSINMELDNVKNKKQQ